MGADYSMFSLKSKGMMPPGGWQYFQPQINWKLPNPMSHSWRTAVDTIVSMRIANRAKLALPTERSAVENDLEMFTVYRLQGHPSFCFVDGCKKKPVVTPAPVSASPSSESRLSIGKAVAKLVEKAGQYANGMKILVEWLGTGAEPVSIETAEQRAKQCLACPKHLTDSWLDKFLTGPIARAIKEQMELKSKLELKTSVDDKLKTCDACGCHMPLKIWCPLELLRAQMDKRTQENLDIKCWIR